MRLRVLGRSEYDQHRGERESNSFLETWDISVEHLRKENRLTYDILHTLAFVDNQNIPLELICEIAQLQRECTISYEESHCNGQSRRLDLRRRFVAKLRKFSLRHIRNFDQKNQAKVHDSKEDDVSECDIRQVTTRL